MFFELHSGLIMGRLSTIIFWLGQDMKLKRRELLRVGPRKIAIRRRAP